MTEDASAEGFEPMQIQVLTIALKNLLIVLLL